MEEIFEKLRWRFYHQTEIFVLIIYVIIVVIFCIFGGIEILADSKDTISGSSATLAGFIFTAQSIMVTFPSNNKFYELLVEYKYIEIFHKKCGRAEMSLLLCMLFSLFLTKQSSILQWLVLFFGIYGVINFVLVLLIFQGIITNNQN